MHLTHYLANICSIWMETKWATWENLFMPYANNKGADQDAQTDQCLSCSLPRSYYMYTYACLIKISRR